MPTDRFAGSASFITATHVQQAHDAVHGGRWRRFVRDEVRQLSNANFTSEAIQSAQGCAAPVAASVGRRHLRIPTGLGGARPFGRCRLGLPLRLCLGTRRHGDDDRSLGKKLRWNRLQKPQHETAKKEWDSMVGINGIQWDSMGFSGIHDVSTEIGLASRLCEFDWPCQGNLNCLCKRPEPNADPDSRG